MRNLEREIGSLCRKEWQEKSFRKGDSFRITTASLETTWAEKFTECGEGESEVGVTTGMAWTQVGEALRSLLKR